MSDDDDCYDDDARFYEDGLLDKPNRFFKSCYDEVSKSSCCERFYFEKVSKHLYSKCYKSKYEPSISQLVEKILEDKLNEKIEKTIEIEIEKNMSIITNKIMLGIEKKFKNDEKIKKYTKRMDETIMKKKKIIQMELKKTILNVEDEIEKVDEYLVNGTMLMREELHNHFSIKFDEIKKKKIIK